MRTGKIPQNAKAPIYGCAIGIPCDGDIMNVYILFSGNLTRGFLYSLQVNFSQIDPYAYFDIRVDDDVMKLQNLTIPVVQDSYGTKPFIHTMAINYPSVCSLDMHADWYFSDKNNVNHEFTATAQIILNDGLQYLKIHLPLKLEVVIL